MAHKKGQSSTKNGRTSKPKYRGVKRQHGQFVTSGSILVRQVGNKFHSGQNVGTGKDFTLFAMRDGIVAFRTRHNNKKFVSVNTAE